MIQAVEIGVEGLKVGMVVEADYYNPTGSGRIDFNFVQDSNNIVFHFNPRFSTTQNAFVLNTLIAGTWGTEETPHGYDFGYGIRIKLRIYADNDNFKIFINDKFFYQYKYRGITGSQVKKIQFGSSGNDATVAQLISLRIGYTPDI